MLLAKSIFVAAFTAVSFACALTAAKIYASIAGTPLDERVNARAKELHDQQKRAWNFQGFAWMGKHPFNEALWKDLVDAADAPETISDSRNRLKALMRMRLVMMGVGTAAMAWFMLQPHRVFL